MKTTVLFRDLDIGDTFDFVDDARPHFNTFFSRCTKTSDRKYSWTVVGPPDAERNETFVTLTTRVGTINVEVFHVEEAAS